MAEQRPPSRLVLLAASAAVVLLTIGGVLLVRPGFDRVSETSPSAIASTGAAVRATVISRVTLGPGLVVSGSQHVRFVQPVSSLTLTVPQRTTTVDGGEFDPRVSNMQILLGEGAPLNVSQTLKAGATVTVRLPAETTELDLIYVAYGAVVRSAPSSSNRAVAIADPLTLVPGSGLTTRVDISGTHVTNIGCTRPDGSAHTCGVQTSDGWTVTRGPTQQDTTVIAQLDLQS